ncbi:GntR family transcriptional regulator [Mobilicoccus massiliensis]|uniref:GntR family transcriptional regulator n=1 Tax=Mobilicoccus massiliensis TaxID=1522310 RepID=UPI001FE4A7FD|nr:GntR family transcriptional regulator [Mobilicoccus massiliensis]
MTTRKTANRRATRTRTEDMPLFAPIVQDSTPALIAQQLREAIAEGRFVPGQQLLETSLAASLGVSRGPLREAMQRLTQEGLLVGHRNRGLFVMDLDEATVRDMYLARGAVERAAVECLVDTGNGPSAIALLDIVAEMRAEDGAPDGPEIAALDMRFHQRLVALTGSPRLVRMHDTLLTQVRLCLARMQATYDDTEIRASEHEAIARAIVDGDKARATGLLAEHMNDGLRRVLAVLEAEDA